MTSENMSTDQREKLRTSQASIDQQSKTDKQDKPRKFELSLSQVLGGALAAMTAAAIGSRLGSAGTVIGAAAASVVAAVSGAVYTASVRHTQEKVRTVWPVRWKINEPATVQLVSDRSEPNAAVAPAQQLARPERPRNESRGLRLPWKTAVVAALLAFGIAAAVITGLELVSGHALSGDDGTTISQVRRPDPTPESTSSSEEERKPKDGAPTATSEPTQSGLQTESASSAPRQTAAQRQTPSAAPTSSAAAPSSTPKASAPNGRPAG
jgi:hypothetical protein